MDNSYVDWLRKRVGSRKVFLPFATVVVRDSLDRILLQQRTDFDFWGMPGGVLELYEDWETCARRELREETGLEVGDLRLVGVYTDPRYDVSYPNGDQVQQFTVCFEGVVSGGQMQPDGLESRDQLFLPAVELTSYPIPGWYRDMIADALQNRSPRFKSPFAGEQMTDQIKSVRPFVGSDRFSAVAAAVIATRDDGRILMLQHAAEDDWRPPAGFCHLGENVAHTAVRVLQEKTGLRNEPERILAVHATPKLNFTTAHGDKIRYVGVVFHAQVEEQASKLDNRALTTALWMTKREAIARSPMPFRWLYQRVLAHLDHGAFVC